MKQKICVFWFRRDLRLEDNAGLYHALKCGKEVLPIFIFDTNILAQLEDKKDKRVDMIRQVLVHIQQQLEEMGATLYVLYSTPEEAFAKLTEEYAIEAVYTNTDYEPYATKRDGDILNQLQVAGIAFHSYKDQVIFEKAEVMKDNDEPYSVFTPYSRRWKEKLNHFYLKAYPTKKYWRHFVKMDVKRIPSLKSMGFEETEFSWHPPVLDIEVAKTYDKTRDLPAVKGTTQLSPQLRFGTISIRALAAACQKLNGVLLNELIWREFYQMMLWHAPRIVDQSFKPQYDNIQWRNNEAEFDAWCRGATGYPIVDAGMRQLNETGWMHNRVRMVTASFLCKHLLIDWRWGDAYFAQKLLDYDLAANNGGFQWSSGSGADAAPYFRVFNPYTQQEKFDPELKYVKHWVPEYGTKDYPQPIVDHAEARKRCLEVYKKGLDK